MIDSSGLICLGLAGSLASAGLAPLITWLVERGYVDLVVSTSANVTEDLLEARGVNFHRVDPDRVDARRTSSSRAARTSPRSRSRKFSTSTRR